MNESYWELIAKHLASETNPNEEAKIQQLLTSDATFKMEFEASKKMWDTIRIAPNSYNRERIIQLRNRRIKNTENKRRKGLFLKYAAIFIGFALSALFIYHDMNSTITIVSNDANTLELTLPDSSTIIMKNDAEITYSNSMLFAFKREVNLKGEAFFKITKSEGKNFIVHTNDYDIEVWGTQFDVITDTKESRVVLTEGKISLNHFQNATYENTFLEPGQMACFNHLSNNLDVTKVNTRIYTSWTKQHIDFDNFTISELGEIFKLHYNKTLIVEADVSLDNRIGGTAPTDDLNLIIKGLSIVLDREIIQQNDTIIIK